MPEGEAYRKGRAMRRQLMGERHAGRLDRTTLADPIRKQFVDLGAETVWGAL